VRWPPVQPATLCFMLSSSTAVGLASHPSHSAAPRCSRHHGVISRTRTPARKASGSGNAQLRQQLPIRIRRSYGSPNAAGPLGPLLAEKRADPSVVCLVRQNTNPFSSHVSPCAWNSCDCRDLFCRRPVFRMPRGCGKTREAELAAVHPARALGSD
jgi:hypothetical protein